MAGLVCLKAVRSPQLGSLQVEQFKEYLAGAGFSYATMIDRHVDAPVSDVTGACRELETGAMLVYCAA